MIKSIIGLISAAMTVASLVVIVETRVHIRLFDDDSGRSSDRDTATRILV